MTSLLVVARHARPETHISYPWELCKENTRWHLSVFETISKFFFQVKKKRKAYDFPLKTSSCSLKVFIFSCRCHHRSQWVVYTSVDFVMLRLFSCCLFSPFGNFCQVLISTAFGSVYQLSALWHAKCHRFWQNSSLFHFSWAALCNKYLLYCRDNSG